MMIPLIIGPGEKAELMRIKHNAELQGGENDLDAVYANKIKAPGSSMDHVCFLPAVWPGMRWKVVYTIDVGGPLGRSKHLSMSIEGGGGRMPRPEVLQMVAEELGMGPSDLMMPGVEEIGEQFVVHYIVLLTEEGKKTLAEWTEEAKKRQELTVKAGEGELNLGEEGG